MSASREKVGFIFECGRDGPDYRVCRHLLERLNPAIEMVPRFLDNTPRLLAECGPVAVGLLTVEKCTRVVVAWDLEPAWEVSGKPCRHNQRLAAEHSLREAEVPLDRALLLCIERELECWLMTDRRALGTVLSRYKSPHPVGKLREYKRPDTQIKRPKTELIRLFQRELGKGQKYLDRNHALPIAQAIPDWSKLKRSDSFLRFVARAARASI